MSANSNTPVWDDGNPWREFPQLAGELTADVCVVGLGGSGLAAVSKLVTAGASVIGLDAGLVAGGAAGRNGGFLLAGTAAFHHDAVRQLGRETAVSWYLATLQELERMDTETPGLLNRSGSLRIASDEEELKDCHEHLLALQTDGLPGEAYEGPEGSGLLIPGDATFNPLQRCRLLARKASKSGAQLFENSPAAHISGTRVDTALGSVHCHCVLVAVDGNLAAVLPELSKTVRPLRLQMLAAAPTRELTLTRPVYARWGYEYWQQRPDGSVTLGGFRDQGGTAEWTSDSHPSEQVQQLLEVFLREQLRVSSPVTHRWAATVGYRNQPLPVRQEVRSGVWAVGGYNGTGNLIGAVSGRAAAAQILQRLSSRSVTAP